MEEKGGIVTGDSAVRRGTYSTKLRSRQDNGCPSLAHSHTVSTQLYQTPHSFLLPLLSSALSLPFSPVRLSSPHHRGMGDNETPAGPERAGVLSSLSPRWLPPHLVRSRPWRNKAVCSCAFKAVSGISRVFVLVSCNCPPPPVSTHGAFQRKP